jgi:hypothetical protein
MLITELLQEENSIIPLRKPWMSARFVKEFAAEKSYPGFLNNFVKFLKHYETSPVTIPYNAKDGNLSAVSTAHNLNPPMRRCHVKAGKIIVFYQISPTVIKLIAVGPHDLEEKNNLDRICDYAKRLKDSDFIQHTSSDKKSEESKPITPEQIDDIVSLFKLLAASPQDKHVLEQLVIGNIEPFMEWARATIDLDIHDTSCDKSIIAGLNGKKSAIALAKRSLN